VSYQQLDSQILWLAECLRGEWIVRGVRGRPLAKRAMITRIINALDQHLSVAECLLGYDRPGLGAASWSSLRRTRSKASIIRRLCMRRVSPEEIECAARLRADNPDDPDILDYASYVARAAREGDPGPFCTVGWPKAGEEAWTYAPPGGLWEDLHQRWPSLKILPDGGNSCFSEKN